MGVRAAAAVVLGLVLVWAGALAEPPVERAFFRVRSAAADAAPSAEASDSLAEASVSEKIERVLAAANALCDRPYAEDGEPPESFNCAGFVAFCFAQADVELPDTARGQGFDGDYAMIAAAANLQPGDVVCFDTDPSDGNPSDHTGVYLGEGHFAHASSAAGQVVVSSLDSGYYKSAFSWGRRIFG